MPELIQAVPLTPGWHAARRAGVTATDIVTILGLSSWDSQYSLFWRKLGQVPEQEDNDRMRLGRELEPIIFARWEEQNPELTLFAGGLYRHSERPWQMATLDARVVQIGPVYSLLEVKSWADADRHSWQDAPPARVRAQVLWQMDVMDVAVGHVGVVFLPSGEFRSSEIRHIHNLTADPLEFTASLGCDVCADLILMRAAGLEFMQRLNLELPPPDPDSSAATLAAVRARFTRQPDKQAEVDVDTMWAWWDTRTTIKRLEEQARGYEIELREQAGEAGVLTVDGQPVARRVIVDAQVKAHTRHQDYLKRIKQDGDDSDG